jgi:hypothetical protein
MFFCALMDSTNGSGTDGTDGTGTDGTVRAAELGAGT